MFQLNKYYERRLLSEFIFFTVIIETFVYSPTKNTLSQNKDYTVLKKEGPLLFEGRRLISFIMKDFGHKG